MDGLAPGPHAWKLTGSIAELTCGALSARVNVARPELGVQQVAFDGRSLEAQLLRIESDGTQPTPRSWPVADAYVRGNDLVASYRPRDDWPFSPQVYWQAAASRANDELLASLYLFVSVQTQLLDTWPRVSIRSLLPAEETIHLTAETSDAREQAVPSVTVQPGRHTYQPSSGPTCVLQRIPGGELSYAEAMPAGDFRELVVERNARGRCETRWTLFSNFLEKGVIWRARLQAVWLPRARDVELAAACCRELQQRPLPLTV
jgi:hypothetical protein